MVIESLARDSEICINMSLNNQHALFKKRFFRDKTLLNDVRIFSFKRIFVTFQKGLPEQPQIICQRGELDTTQPILKTEISKATNIPLVRFIHVNKCHSNKAKKI